MAFYPIFLSLGLGGSIMAAFWFIVHAIYKKVKSWFVCSVTLNMYDDTFKWVLKYVKDKKLIKLDNVLKAKRKEEEEHWWEWIFNRHQQ